MPTIKRLSPSPVAGAPALRTTIETGSPEDCRITLQGAPIGVYCYQSGVGADAKTLYFIRTKAIGMASLAQRGVTEAEAEAEVALQRTAVEAMVAAATADAAPAPVPPIVLDASTNAQAALAAAGQDFLPERRRLFAEAAPVPRDAQAVSDYSTAPFDGQMPQAVPTHVRIVRGDTGAHLSVMGADYAPVAARLWFAVLNPQAMAGRIRFGLAHMWDAVQTLHFRLPHESIPGLHVGGVMTTSHDGSAALRATATVELFDRTIYSRGTWSTRHTRFAADRLTKMAPEIMETVVAESEALIVACANAQHVDGGTAADTILSLPAFAEIVERRAKVDAADGDAVAASKWATAIAEARTELAAKGAQYPSYLGGLRFVLAAGSFGGRGEATDYSWHMGVARERATAALAALSTVGASLRLALSEDAIQALNGLSPEARKGHVEAAKRRLMERLGEQDAAA